MVDEDMLPLKFFELLKNLLMLLKRKMRTNLQQLSLLSWEIMRRNVEDLLGHL
jgi:hypothetical protein